MKTMLDSVTNYHTAFRTFAELLAECQTGYVPTIHAGVHEPAEPSGRAAPRRAQLRVLGSGHAAQGAHGAGLHRVARGRVGTHPRRRAWDPTRPVAPVAAAAPARAAAPRRGGKSCGFDRPDRAAR